MPPLNKLKLFSLLPQKVRTQIVNNHRLSSSCRLKNRKLAQDFILERGLVSVFSDPELPSIQDAIDGFPDNPQDQTRIRSGKGIASIWLRDLPEFVPCLFGTFLKQNPTLITQNLWANLVAIEKGGFQDARAENRISPTAFRLSDYIDKEGPTTGQILFENVGRSGRIERQKLQRALEELKKLWLILPHQTNCNFQNTTACTWELTIRLVPKKTLAKAASLTRRSAMLNLLGSTIESTGAVDEKAIYRWFPWPRSMTRNLIEEALSSEQCYRVDGPNTVIISTDLADIWPKN